MVVLDPSGQLEIVVNGEPRSVPDRLSIAELLAQLAVEPKHVAVEVNQEMVPRARHAEVQLKRGDRVEVVTLVGGG